MKTVDVKIGAIVWTRVGADRVQCRVISILPPGNSRMYGRSGRFRLERIDTGAVLPKRRNAVALHFCGHGYWPSMAESRANETFCDSCKAQYNASIAQGEGK